MCSLLLTRLLTSCHTAARVLEAALHAVQENSLFAVLAC